MKNILLVLPLLVLFSCEPTFQNGKISCDPRATNQCPTGFICMEVPGVSGEYRCYNSYTTLGWCGDGEVQEKFEDCDPGLLPTTTCGAMGYHEEDTPNTTVTCLSNCRWDDNVQCANMKRCGDGIWDEEVEDCDGEQGLSGCWAYNGNYTSGFPVCTSKCTVDEGYCYANMGQKVDLLMVIDDTNREDMMHFRERLKSSVGSFFSKLTASSMSMGMEMGGLDLHVGVVSSSLYVPSACKASDVTDGVLMGGAQCGVGNSFLVDSSPDCLCIGWDNSGNCVDTNCAPDACDAVGTGLSLYYNDIGMPRCGNFDATELGVLGRVDCLIDVDPEVGCTVSQPLMAMDKALDPELGLNPGFLREDALLVVAFITSHDDCSIYDANRFNAVLNQFPESHTFVCTKGGLVCSEDFEKVKESTEGSKVFSGCVPRTDDERTLHDPEYFINRVWELKNQKNIIAFTLSGDFSGSITLESYEGPYIPEIPEGDEPYEEPEEFTYTYALRNSCINAKPSPRLQYFVRRYSALDPNEGIHSICDSFYPSALGSLDTTIDSIFNGMYAPEM